MKKFVRFYVDEDIVREVSGSIDVEEAFGREVQILNASGISEERILNEDEVIIVDSSIQDHSSSPLNYARACEEYLKLARSIVEEDGVFKSYEGNVTLRSKLEDATKAETKFEQLAKSYALEVVDFDIKRKRSEIKIDTKDKDCVEKAIDRTKILLKETILSNHAPDSHEGRMEVVSSIIFAQTKPEDSFYDANQSMFVYTEKMQTIADKIYDEVMSAYEEDGEFNEMQQRVLMEKLIKKGYLSQDVAEIIIQVNNGDDYENILTDESLRKTVFTSYLEQLAKK